MAIQFDGSGKVTFPLAETSGDFSVIFDSVKITNPSSWGMLAGMSTSSQHFIGISSPSTVKARIANSTFTTGYAGSVGEVVKVEVNRVGSFIFLLIDDVQVDTRSSSGLVEFDEFGAYLGDSLKYTGVIGGIITMTGFTGGTRTYDTDGTGTTLVDTTSSQNGTLDGFTTGGFVAPATGIEITSITDSAFKLADISGNATFTVAGTTTATTEIEYSIDNETTWQTLDVSPNGSSFTGSVIVNGQVDIHVRVAADVLDADVVTNISATEINILFWGQSNEVSRLTNFNTITVGAEKPTPLKYLPTTSAFSIASDPTGMGNGTPGGSTASRIAQAYSDAGVLVGIVNVAEGGTRLDQWLKPSVLYTRLANAVNDIGGITFASCIIGESDAGAGTSTADAITRMTSICTDINTDFGVDTYISYFIDATGTGTPENILKIRNAYDSVIADNEFVKFGGDAGLIDTGGNIHMTTDAMAIELTGYRYDAFTSSAVSSLLNLTATGYPDGTYSAEFYQATAPLVHIKTENITFSSGASSATMPLAASTTVYTRIDGATPPSTGVTCYGVTV